MKKTVVITLGLAAVLGAVATAEAFKPGTYEGSTQRGRPLSFEARKAKLTAFKIKVHYACSDFDEFWTREKRFPALRISEEGRFAGYFTNADGSYTAKIKGTLTGKTATGSFSAERTYDARGNLNPNGKITCVVHKTKWAAKRTRT